MKDNNPNITQDSSGKFDKYTLENDSNILSEDQNLDQHNKTSKMINMKHNYFQNENSLATNKDDTFVAASDNASIRKEPLNNLNYEVESTNNAGYDKLSKKTSISFREVGKLIKSKLSRSILNSNYPSKVSEYDANCLKGSGIAGNSKTPIINHKKPRREDEELLVNPNNTLYTEEDDIFINQLQNKKYFFDVHSKESINKRTFNCQTSNNYNINQAKHTRDINKDKEDGLQGRNDNNKLEGAYQNMTNASPISEQNENPQPNKKISNSNICIDNSFGEKMVEIKKEVKLPKSMKVYFSVYFPPSLLQVVAEEFKESYENPLVFKILIPVKSDETFNPIMQRFINEVNINLKEHSLRLMDMEEAIKFKHGNLKNLEEQTIYLPKCMKNSGKPDYDLPGFDLRIMLEEINVNRFALAYEPFCLVSLLKESSARKISCYISTTDIIEDATEDETSSSCMSNSIKYNNKMPKSLGKIKEKENEQLEEEDTICHDNCNTKDITVQENQQINYCCKGQTKTNTKAQLSDSKSKKKSSFSEKNNSKIIRKDTKCCDGCLVF